MAYQQDSDTKLLIKVFSIDSPPAQLTILKLPVVYRTVNSRNQLGILKDHLVYYEQIFFANEHICRIVVPFFTS